MDNKSPKLANKKDPKKSRLSDPSEIATDVCIKLAGITATDARRVSIEAYVCAV